MDNFGFEKIEHCSKIYLGANNKFSKRHAVISFNDQKKLFEITNLSKNLIFVNKKYLGQFESSKIKNKNPLIIGREMLFFIYSKAALSNYYKRRTETLSKITERSLISGNNLKTTINNFVAPMNVNISCITTENKLNHKKTKKKIYMNSNLNNDCDSDLKEDRLNISNYAFENILPPNPETIFNRENENILDDLIESSNRKIRINNKP